MRDASATRALALERDAADPGHWPRAVRELGDEVRAAQRAVERSLHAAAEALRREDVRRVRCWLRALAPSHKTPLGQLLRRTSGGFVGIDVESVRISLRTFLTRHALQRSSARSPRSALNGATLVAKPLPLPARLPPPSARASGGVADAPSATEIAEEELDGMLEGLAASVSDAQHELWGLVETYLEVPPLLLVPGGAGAEGAGGDAAPTTVRCVRSLRAASAAMDKAYDTVRATLPAKIRAVHARGAAAAAVATTSDRLRTELLNRMLALLKATTVECAASRSKLRRALAFTVDGARVVAAWNADAALAAQRERRADRVAAVLGL